MHVVDKILTASLTLGLCLTLLALVAYADTHTTYSAARVASVKDGKPLVVLVTASWCPPCQKLKSTTLPDLIKRDSFRDVHFVNLDIDKDLDAKNLIAGRGLPTFIKWSKATGTWVESSLSGYQNTTTVENFLN